MTRKRICLLFFICFPLISSAQNAIYVKSAEGGDSTLIQDIRKLSFENESLVIDLRNSEQDKVFFLANISEISFIYDKSIVGVQKTPTDFSCSFFPNPVMNLLNIDVPVTQMKLIEICNIQGQKVNNWHRISERQIDVSSLEPGLCLIRVLHGDKIIISKFLKS